MFFSLIPLMAFWMNEKSWKRVFFAGWFCQFIFTAIGFNWVYYTISEFGRMPWWLALPGTLIYFCFANLHVPIAGLIWHFFFRNSKNILAKAVALSSLVALCERHYPMIFDWHLGYTWLWARFPAFQLADLIGFFGLSSINWLFQGLFLFTLFKFSGWKRLSGLAASISLFLTMNLAGWLHQPQYENQKTTRVAIIQANIGNLEKQLAEKGYGFRQSILDRYFEISHREMTNKPDFLVWPETAYPDYLTPQAYEQGLYGRQVKRFLTENDGLLVSGTYSLAQSGQMTNSIVVLSKYGFEQEPYHKSHLLAFGEFIPGSKHFPQLKSWLPMVADFARGPGPSVLNVHGIKVGMQICYEGLDDDFTRQLSNQGAQVLLNVTNDSWFGTWQEPYQHMTVTLSRAIEVRRPLIRSTNTGISTVQLASGETLKKSPLSQEWSHTYEVPYLENPKSTIFAGFGYWVIPILLVALLAWAYISRNKTY